MDHLSEEIREDLITEILAHYREMKIIYPDFRFSEAEFIDHQCERIRELGLMSYGRVVISDEPTEPLWNAPLECAWGK